MTWRLAKSSGSYNINLVLSLAFLPHSTCSTCALEVVSPLRMSTSASKGSSPVLAHTGEDTQLSPGRREGRDADLGSGNLGRSLPSLWQVPQLPSSSL